MSDKDLDFLNDYRNRSWYQKPFFSWMSRYIAHFHKKKGIQNPQALIKMNESLLTAKLTTLLEGYLKRKNKINFFSILL
jgi:hypothetical protein